MKRSIPLSTSIGLVALTVTSLIGGCQTFLFETASRQCHSVNSHIQAIAVPDALVARLDDAPATNAEREQLARQYLDQACPQVQSYLIPGSPLKSHACVIEGTSDQRIVIGAHYDKARSGAGVADNWTGVVITAALLEHFVENPPQRSLEFVMFGEEEPGMAGSSAYLAVRGNTGIHAMVNIDTLGLGPVTIDTRSDRELFCIALESGKTLAIETRSNGLRQSIGDWKPFQRQDVPFLNVHSLNQDRLAIVHTWRDRRRIVDDQYVIDAYRLLLNTLLAMDE